VVKVLLSSSFIVGTFELVQELARKVLPFGFLPGPRCFGSSFLILTDEVLDDWQQHLPFFFVETAERLDRSCPLDAVVCDCDLGFRHGVEVASDCAEWIVVGG